MSLAVHNVDVLRHGWEDTVNAVAPGVPDLPDLLESRLNTAAQEDRLDEASLLEIVQELAGIVTENSGADTARLLSRGLQRAVYEYLLSLDALGPQETATLTPLIPLGNGDAGQLIGVEEVAELEGHQAEAEHAEPVAASVEAAEAEAAPQRDEESEESEAPAVDPAEATADAAEETGGAEADAVDLEASVEHEAAAEPAAAAEPEAAVEDEAPAPVPAPVRRPRFRIFRGGADRTQVAALEQAEPEPEPALHPEAEAPAEPEPAAPEEVAPEPSAPGGGVAAMADALADVRFVVAPRDGFHLTDHTEMLPQTHAQAFEQVTAAEPKPERTKARGWRVREHGPADIARGHEPGGEANADVLVAMLEEDDTASRTRFDNDPQVIEARRQINDRLRRRRCDDAASLLQKLSAEIGGRPVAELGLDAGDRCRALGKANAALSCYLAASRADPVHETPLLRLADICLDDKDIELAVSYLDRVARLHRLRGDTKGALRIYRKIATIAPYRDDILATLMRAQATGHFED